MDLNLTGPIAAQIADNLTTFVKDSVNQPEDHTEAVLAIIAAVIGAGGALLGVSATNRFNLNLEKWKFKSSEFQKKKDAIAKLNGKKPMDQRYKLLGRSKIYQKYYAKLLDIQEFPMLLGTLNTKEFFKEELKRWQVIDNDSTKEIASDNKDLHETLGTIQTSFPMVSTKDLENADEMLNEHIKSIGREIETIPKEKLEDLLIKAVEKAEKNWEATVKKEFYDKIENLISRLKEELAKEKDPTL